MDAYMNKTRLVNFWNIFFVAMAIFILIVLIDLFTNSLDIHKYDWDFKFYIAFAEDGFSMDKLSSPGAYRYMTPFLVSALHTLSSLSIPEAFKILSYMGLWLQLMGIYLFVSYYSKSTLGGIVAMLVTAFSAVNVKFLLFDPFRPDIFAYFIVVLAVYLALKKRVLWLMIVTAIGVQFREFTIVPLIAYFLNLGFNREWSELKRYAIPFILTLIVSVLLPRMLIPITYSYQNFKSINDLLVIPLNGWRDFNWLYTILLYFLPTFILLTRSKIKKIKELISPQDFTFITIYALLVALLSMYGGTDLARFTTYFFIPQIVMIGFLAPLSTRMELIYMLTALFFFNKIHTDIPVWNSKLYMDWYGGYANIVTTATYMHLLRMVLIIGVAVLLRKLPKTILPT